jgi:hypothetical protein
MIVAFVITVLVLKAIIVLLLVLMVKMRRNFMRRLAGGDVGAGCIHHYEALAVTALEKFNRTRKEGDLPYFRGTRVLWGCRSCPARIVQTLDGNWSLDEVRRRRTPAKGYESPWEAGVQTR